MSQVRQHPCQYRAGLRHMPSQGRNILSVHAMPFLGVSSLKNFRPPLRAAFFCVVPTPQRSGRLMRMPREHPRLIASGQMKTPPGEIRRGSLICHDIVNTEAFLVRHAMHPAGQAATYSPTACCRSTIGAEGFNDRVRNGIGFGPLAIATWPAGCIG